MMNQKGKTKLWYLKDTDIFGWLKNDEMNKIINKTSSMRKVRKGEILYIDGSSENKIYFLKEGVIKINRIVDGGRAITIDILKSGAMIGELDDIDSLELMETAEVMEDGLICSIRKEDFHEILRSVPELSKRCAIYAISRKYKIELRLIDMIFRSVKERLAKTLLTLIDDFGVKKGNYYILKIDLTHQDIAELIASTRETVTSTLNNLRKEGVIDYKNRYIKILDKEKLEKMSKRIK